MRIEERNIEFCVLTQTQKAQRPPDSVQTGLNLKKKKKKKKYLESIPSFPPSLLRLLEVRSSSMLAARLVRCVWSVETLWVFLSPTPMFTIWRQRLGCAHALVCAMAMDRTTARRALRASRDSRGHGRCHSQLEENRKTRVSLGKGPPFGVQSALFLGKR